MITGASRFPDEVSLRQVAATVGVPVEVVLHVCDTHSLTGQQPDSIVGQAVAERVARFIEGQER